MSRWHRYKISTGATRKRTRGSTYHDLPSANSLKYLFVCRVRVTLLDRNYIFIHNRVHISYKIVPRLRF